MRPIILTPAPFVKKKPSSPPPQSNNVVVTEQQQDQQQEEIVIENEFVPTNESDYIEEIVVETDDDDDDDDDMYVEEITVETDDDFFGVVEEEEEILLEEPTDMMVVRKDDNNNKEDHHNILHDTTAPAETTIWYDARSLGIGKIVHDDDKNNNNMSMPQQQQQQVSSEKMILPPPSSSSASIQSQQKQQQQQQQPTKLQESSSSSSPPPASPPIQASRQPLQQLYQRLSKEKEEVKEEVDKGDKEDEEERMNDSSIGSEHSDFLGGEPVSAAALSLSLSSPQSEQAQSHDDSISLNLLLSLTEEGMGDIGGIGGGSDSTVKEVMEGREGQGRHFVVPPPNPQVQPISSTSQLLPPPIVASSTSQLLPPPIVASSSSLRVMLENYYKIISTTKTSNTTTTNNNKKTYWVEQTLLALQKRGVRTREQLLHCIGTNPTLEFRQGISQTMISSIQLYLQDIVTIETEHETSKSSSLSGLTSSSFRISSEDWNNEDQLKNIILQFFMTQQKRFNFSMITNEDDNVENENEKEKKQHNNNNELLWVQEMTTYCHANGWSTGWELLLALQQQQKSNHHDHPTTMELLLLMPTFSTSSSPPSSSTTRMTTPTSTTTTTTTVTTTTKSTINRFNQFQIIATLHQFLSEQWYYTELCNPQRFPLLLYDFAQVVLEKDQWIVHHHHHQQQQTSTKTAATTTTTPQAWVTYYYEQFLTIGINTLYDLIQSIQQNKIEKQLDTIYAIQRWDVYTQQQLVHYFTLSSSSSSSSSSGIHPSYTKESRLESIMAISCPEEVHFLLPKPITSLYHRDYDDDDNMNIGFTYRERQQFYTRPYESRLFLSLNRSLQHNHRRRRRRRRRLNKKKKKKTGTMMNEDGDDDDDDDDEEALQGWLRTRFSDQASHDMELQKYSYVVWQAQKQRQQQQEQNRQQQGRHHSNICFASVDATFSSILATFFYNLDCNTTAASAGWDSTSTTYRSSHYYSEACILASALSQSCRNVHFGLDPNDVVNEKTNCGDGGGQDLQQDFGIIMKVLFRNVVKHKFLGRNCNTYRLAHCLTEGSSNKFPLWIPFFSFFIQCSLIAYVVWELVENVILDVWPSYPTFSWELLGLGIVTSLYSVLQARRGWQTVRALTDIYQYNCGPCCSPWVGLLAVADVFVNLILPIIVAVAGCLIVAVQDTLIHGVLIATVLLFVPQIDEELPRLLKLNSRSIIETYLIRKAVDELNIALQPNEYRMSFLQRRINTRYAAEKIEFSDIVVTNSRVQGSDPRTNSLFGPHEVKESIYAWSKNGRRWGEDRVYLAKNQITEDCLLKEVKWRYKRDHRLAKGQVDRLLLVRLDGGRVELSDTDLEDVDLDTFLSLQSISDDDNKNRDNSSTVEDLLADTSATVDPKWYGLGGERETVQQGQQRMRHHKPINFEDLTTPNEWDGEVRGIFIVTSFEVKHCVTKLRICGSRSDSLSNRDLGRAKRNFKRAIDYYCLWDLDASAERILNSHGIASITTSFGTRIGRFMLKMRLCVTSICGFLSCGLV